MAHQMTRTAYATALPPTGLLCELMASPERTRITNPTPLFGWVVNDLAPGGRQIAYQILVASSRELLAEDRGDLWDSGTVDVGGLWHTVPQSLHVPYAGTPLASGTTYHWKVRTWNASGELSYYSEPQTFHTGELTDAYATPRYPVEQHAIAPTRVVQTGGGQVFIDFGKAAFGTLQFTVTSPTDCAVEVHLGEVANGPHAIRRDPGGHRRYYCQTVPVQAGRQTYTLALPPREVHGAQIAMPEHIGEVLPFRYAELHGLPGPVTRDDIRQLAAFYPFDETAAAFTSSDPALNAVWEMSKYTMKATSFCGVYVDGDRERLPYAADAYINQLGHYCCDREFLLARYSHEYLLTHPSWPTEWFLFSVLIAWADYMQTGETSSLEHWYPDLQADTLTALAGDDGLISVKTGLVTDEVLRSIHYDRELRDVIDWPLFERDEYEIGVVNTVPNALHYRALVLMSRIAQVLGHADDADAYRCRATRVRAAMQEKLIDPDTGLFVDNTESRHSSLHANCFPLAFGLVPEENMGRVLAFIKRKGMACSVYAAQLLLDACYRAGEDDYALSLMTATHERSWMHMLAVGSTVALEAWDDRFKPNQDWNHAWGAAPANIIPRRLMGIRALEPGFGRILIHPQPGTLAFAEMTMPTIRGSVTVGLHNRPGHACQLDVTIPANTSARVLMPSLGCDDLTLYLDGQPIIGTLEGDRIVLDPLPAGTHTILRCRA